LADLARRTRIRLENLESLEKDDLGALPTDPYVRGFVKQVCRELGLPTHDGLRRYEYLRETAAPSDEIVWAVERSRTETAAWEGGLPDPDRAVGLVGRYGLWVGGAAALALLAFVALRAFDRAEPSPPPPTTTTERVAPAPTVADAPGETQPTGESTPRELLDDAPGVVEGPPALALADVATYRGETVPTDEPVASRTQPPVQSPVEPRAATPTPPTPEPRGADRTEAPREARDDPPPPPPRPTASSRLVLTVRALQDVEVAVLLDGVGHPRTKSLRAGESKSWKADARFVLEASDGGSLRVFLDGEDRGLAGPAGAPVSRLVIRPGASR
jgi:cytoskeleton protein RodZ